MDTIERRWRRLYPHVVQLGPSGNDRLPAVLIFHGCGGVRRHLQAYAVAAARAGVRAFLIDSYGPRGWNKRWAQHTVCTGLMFRGGKRAGDVLAAVWGVSQIPGVDPERIGLAGWSHGSWAIMDLMAMPLERRGEAGLADPSPEPLARVKSLFLAYPYIGLASKSRSGVWLRAPRTFGVVPRRDHLGSVRAHMRAYGAAVAAGADVEIWSVDATHAFDEPGIRAPLPITFDPDLGVEAVGKFEKFVTTSL
jgi:dienelactone hydrolase